MHAFRQVDQACPKCKSENLVSLQPEYFFSFKKLLTTGLLHNNSYQHEHFERLLVV